MPNFSPFQYQHANSLKDHYFSDPFYVNRMRYYYGYFRPIEKPYTKEVTQSYDKGATAANKNDLGLTTSSYRKTVSDYSFSDDVSDRVRDLRKDFSDYKNTQLKSLRYAHAGLEKGELEQRQ